MSNAVSARYQNPCGKCLAKAYEPCRTLTTGRITDTHRIRIDEQFTRTLVRKQQVPSVTVSYLAPLRPVQSVVTERSLDALSLLGYSRSQSRRILMED